MCFSNRHCLMYFSLYDFVYVFKDMCPFEVEKSVCLDCSHLLLYGQIPIKFCERKYHFNLLGLINECVIRRVSGFLELHLRLSKMLRIRQYTQS